MKSLDVHVEFLLVKSEIDSSGPADWHIEPVLPDGARLFASLTGGTGSSTFSDSTGVWVSGGDIATNYIITANHPQLPTASDTAVLHAVAIELPLTGFFRVGSSERRELAAVIKNLNGSQLAWSLEPELPDGARLFASSSGGEGSLSFSGASSVWVLAGAVATNYTLVVSNTLAPAIQASMEISVIDITLNRGSFGMRTDATEREPVVATLLNMEVEDLAWALSPNLLNGARLHIGAASVDDETILSGIENVWLSAGSVATNYVLTAFHRLVGHTYGHPMIAATSHVGVLSFTLNRTRAVMKTQANPTNAFTVSASDGAQANWKLEPQSIFLGARLAATPNKVYASTVEGTNTVWVNPGESVTNYTVTATHPDYTNLTASATLVAADIRLEPITVERLSDERLYNPCGVPVGDSRKFRIDIEAAENALPDADILWSGDAGVSFPDGENGRMVSVTTSAAQVQTLSVDIADLIGPPPEISFKGISAQTIPVRFMVVVNEQGQSAATAEHCTNLVADANLILDQVGITLALESVAFTNRYNWYSFNPLDTQNDIQLLSSLPTDAGFEVYIVDEIEEFDGILAWGLNYSSGSVLKGTSEARTLAHEILHQCGTEDIYSDSGGVSLSFSTTLVSSSLPHDYTGGQSYYANSTGQRNLVSRLLMTPGGFDIPLGQIKGVGYLGTVSGVRYYEIRSLKVGLLDLDSPIQGHQ